MENVGAAKNHFGRRGMPFLMDLNNSSLAALGIDITPTSTWPFSHPHTSATYPGRRSCHSRVTPHNPINRTHIPAIQRPLWLLSSIILHLKGKCKLKLHPDRTWLILTLAYPQSDQLMAYLSHSISSRNKADRLLPWAPQCRQTWASITDMANTHLLPQTQTPLFDTQYRQMAGKCPADDTRRRSSEGQKLDV